MATFVGIAGPAQTSEFGVNEPRQPPQPSSQEMTDSRAVLAKAVTEDDLLTTITQAATWYGWRWTHIRRSDKAQQMGHSGWPDLFLTKNGTAYAIELKRHGNRPTPDQHVWLAELDKVPGITAYVVLPDLLDWFLDKLRA